jgi:hypothetical protein
VQATLTKDEAMDIRIGAAVTAGAMLEVPV